MYFYRRRYKLYNKNDKIFKIVNLLIGNVAAWFKPILKDFINNKENDKDLNTEELFSAYVNFEKKLLAIYGNPDKKRLVV